MGTLEKPAFKFLASFSSGVVLKTFIKGRNLQPSPPPTHILYSSYSQAFLPVGIFMINLITTAHITS